MWWLSIKGKAMEWIDVGKSVGFALEVWNEVAGWIPVVLRMSGFGEVLAAFVEWLELGTVDAGLVWACLYFCFFLVCFLLQFVLDFGLVFSYKS